MRKLLSFALATLLVLTMVSSFGAALAETAAVEVKEGQTKVVFWHSAGGKVGEAIDALVKSFNESQDKIVVEAQYQGTYDDSINKLRGIQKGQGPDVMQLYDIGTRWMIDSKFALTMQDFIDKENYDISDYEPNILAYYTLDGKLYSMPFNCSVPCIVYNKEALAKANVDPKSLTDLASVKSAAEKVAKDGGVQIGAIMPDYSWIFEQMIAEQDKDFLDNGNGRADRATKVVIDENGSGLALLTAWKDFAAQPYTDTLGKGTADSKKAFGANTVGIIMDSCSVYTDLQAAAGGVFNVGLAPLPKLDAGNTGGPSVGGGSLWLMDNGDQARADAAWEFVKFCTSPVQMAEWSIRTGYLPVSKRAVEEPEFQAYLKEQNPDFQIIIDSLRNSKPSNAGSVMGVFSKARVIIESEIETMINDEAVTPEDTLGAIVSQINDEIALYNETNT